MNDLLTEINDRLELLDVALRELKKRSKDYADAEAEYRQALAIRILELREERMPVTIIPDIARGTKNVSMLKVKRDCTEALYKASLEAINVYKLQIKVLEAQLQREWNS